MISPHWKFSPRTTGLVLGLMLLSACASTSYEPGTWSAPSEDVLDRLDSQEELWVIGRDEASPRGRWSGGRGMLVALQQDRGEVPLPLRKTEVRTSIRGPLATTKLRQEFVNSFAATIEVDYLFPLPENASVHEFVVEIGERRIRGVIREREQARRLYEAAIRAGHTAALLDQERPNVFRQRVGNLAPGHDVVVNLEYMHTCSYDAGWHEYVFPSTVAERYSPASSEETLSVATSEPDRDLSQLDVVVDLDAGVKIEDVDSPQYTIDIERASPSRYRIELDPGDRTGDRDFVLRWRVADEDLRSALFSHAGERGVFWNLVLYPPLPGPASSRQPLDLVLVIDSSGSMEGPPLEQARKAAIGLIEKLEPTDTFQILRFAKETWAWNDEATAATKENRRAAILTLESLRASGGTEMTPAIHSALARPRVPGRIRTLWLLTDGFIGNEAEVLKELDASLAGARVFTLGIGSSVNRYLLTAMARMGHGAVSILGSRQDPASAVDAFHSRITQPALTALELEWEGVEASAQTPRRLPDLFAAQMITISGRWKDLREGGVTIRGHAGDGGQTREIKLEVPRADFDSPAVARLWARRRLTELADQRIVSPSPNIDAEMLQLALEFGLVSDLTSFLAIDTATAEDSRGGTRVEQPPRTPRWTPGAGGSRR